MMFVQPHMQQQEELAALFTRNLTLEHVAEPPKEEPKIVYISQHYTHSTHVAPTPPVADDDVSLFAESPIVRPASEPPQPDHVSIDMVLRRHGIDPFCLSASQLQLLKTAEEPQQKRLLELWSTCPPTNSIDNPTLAWTFTTVAQEEILAKARFEQRRATQGQEQMVVSMDGPPLTPVQTDDGRWIPAAQSYMEPYMASGYEDMARREYEESARRAYEVSMAREKDVCQPFGSAVGSAGAYSSATDPVYQNTNGGLDWKHQQMMEDQYGRMMAARNDDEEML